MSFIPTVDNLEVGQIVATREVQVDRARLVRYAGASGDFNPIHWNERFAREVELPGVIAHGMLTMGLGASVITDWLADPAAVISYGVRFTRPIPVPDPGFATLTISASVAAVDVEAKTARIDVNVALGEVKVLGKAQAVIGLK